MAGMTLKPLIRWLSYCHIPPALSAAVVLCLLVTAVGIGFFQLARPAMTWMNDAPAAHGGVKATGSEDVPAMARFSQAADAMNNLGATEEEQKKATTVELKTSRVPSTFINWTGTFLVGVGETLVLLYLMLASGDLFLQKLVRVMPTCGDKKRAVEISHEIQQNISNYLFSVSLINIGLGALVSGGLYWLGVPNAANVGNARGGSEFYSLLRPRRRNHPAGHGRPPHVRHAVERTPSARLVSAAPPFGSELHYAGLAGAPLHAQSGGHFCFVDLLDLALGCARRFVVGADPGLDQSRLRPRPLPVVRQRTAHELSQTSKRYEPDQI